MLKRILSVPFKQTRQSDLGLWLFTLGLALMYAWGVLSTQHFTLGQKDAYVNAWALLFACLGMVTWFYHHAVKFVSLSVGFWLVSFLLIVIQPLLHQVDYIDALVFPAAILFIALSTALAVSNMNASQREFLLHCLAWVLTVVGVLTVVTQALQLYIPTIPLPWLMPIDPNNPRLSGNIAQVNQASFVIALGIAAVGYLLFFYQQVRPNLAIVIGLLVGVLALGIGIGFSASRGGLFLAVAAVIGQLFYAWQGHKPRLYTLVGMAVAVTLGYYLGTWAMNIQQADVLQVSATRRLLGENTLVIRQSLLQQAWMAFSEHPLTGVGYDRFEYFGINHPEIPWLDNADHAHNIIGQIGAEFGILGLLCLGGFVFVVIKQVGLFVRGRLSAYQTLAMLWLIIIGLYSLSEYPLWYARFLVLAAVLVAILDKPILFDNRNFGRLSAIVSAVLVLGLSFYITKYDQYLLAEEMVSKMKIPYEERLKAYRALPNTYGFTKYKDRMLFVLMPIDNDNLDRQLKLGNVMIKVYGDDYVLEKQATLLGYAGQYEKAQRLYQVLCRREQTGKILKNEINTCHDTMQGIKTVNPPHAEAQFQQLKQWVQNHQH